MYELFASIRFPVAALVLILTGCGGGGGGGSSAPAVPLAAAPAAPAPDSGFVEGVFQPQINFRALCVNPRPGLDSQGTFLAENNWLRSFSNETYLWYDEIIDVDPADHPNPLDYFALLKTFALTPSGAPKDRFHFTFDTEAFRQLSQAGVSAGYGVTFVVLSRTPPRKLVISYTEPNTPATTNGVDLTRGETVLEIDGVDFVNANTQAEIDILNAGLAPADVNENHTFLIQAPDSDQTRLVSMQSTEITSTPVLELKTIDTASGPVGYILFNDHIGTAEVALINAVNQLNSAGITDLILDIRYNGGGFLDIANGLAFMIAGPIAAGQTFDELQFNDKHPVFNPITGEVLTPTLFRTVAGGEFSAPAGTQLPSLGLSRVFVLTGPGTCSASESIINGLRGIDVEVIQIGTTTCGKPYGFYAIDNCGTSYFTVQFRAVNAKNFGDYTDGFSPASGVIAGTPLPGCSVADDFLHALGDPEEARVAAALNFRDTGECPDVASSSARLLQSSASNPLAAADGTVIKPVWLQNQTVNH